MIIHWSNPGPAGDEVAMHPALEAAAKVKAQQDTAAGLAAIEARLAAIEDKLDRALPGHDPAAPAHPAVAPAHATATTVKPGHRS